jgi:hypothetical protein
VRHPAHLSQYNCLHPVRLYLVPGALMKPATFLFIAAEVLDILTILVNLTIPAMYEGNPFMVATGEYWVLVKLAIVLVICFAIERFNFGKRAFLVPALAAIPPAWNIGILIYYFVR